MDEREREALHEMRRCARLATAWSREAGRGWTSDEKTVAAVAHTVAQIGELAKRISTSTRAALPAIPWSAIVGMRDRVYHEYEQLDVTVLAATVARDLPDLDRELAAALEGRSSRRRRRP